MLPFLQPKKAVGVIISRRGKTDLHETKPEVEVGEHQTNPDLESACEDIMRAIDERSVKGLAAAFEAAFEVCEEAPHEEGPHLDEEPGE